MAAGWLLSGEPDVRRAVFAALAVLVMGHPCAVGIAAPLAIVRGTAADSGIVMRTGGSLPDLPAGAPHRAGQARDPDPGFGRASVVWRPSTATSGTCCAGPLLRRPLRTPLGPRCRGPTPPLGRLLTRRRVPGSCLRDQGRIRESVPKEPAMHTIVGAAVKAAGISAQSRPVLGVRRAAARRTGVGHRLFTTTAHGRSGRGARPPGPTEAARDGCVRRNGCRSTGVRGQRGAASTSVRYPALPEPRKPLPRPCPVREVSARGADAVQARSSSPLTMSLALPAAWWAMAPAIPDSSGSPVSSSGGVNNRRSV